MKKLNLILIVICLSFSGAFSQSLSYYNGTEGLTGSALKANLNNIIDGQIQYQYSSVKQILKAANEDPANPNNVILFYTGWSIPKSNFASQLDSLDYWNREHVWAKSHGDFGTVPGPGTDCHALRPVDNTVNSARSNKDFDNGGSQYYDNGNPTGCYSDADSWEPRDEVKGDVARCIFYMATRYEGENGELDLELADAVNTAPGPYHGKLSTLLLWNQQDPPDAFEKTHNDVVYNWQHNRNPFVDYPEMVDYIWGSASASPIQISAASINPAEPQANDPVDFTVQITESNGNAFDSVRVYWGLDYFTMNNVLTPSVSGNQYTTTIPGQAAGTKVLVEVKAWSGSNFKHFPAFYKVATEPFTGTLTSIYTIQGQSSTSPLNGQTVSTSGIVTAVFGSNFFLQNGSGAWNGIYIYNSGSFPVIGDSVIVTAEVSEYYDMTELSNVTAFYPVSTGNPLPEPVILPTGSIQDEQYEGVLVKVENAECVRDTSYGMWFVNDGSGDCLIHNSSVYSFNYTIGNIYTITGPLNFDFGEFKIELRSEDDVEAGIDSQAPEISSFNVYTETIMHINFNEDLDQSSAENLANYQIDNGAIIQSAVLHAFDKRKVILTFSPLANGTYHLNMNNIEDLSGNAAMNLSITFSWLDIPDNSQNGEFQLYPNPANDKVYIDLPAQNLNSDLQCRLFSIDGKEIENFFIDKKSSGIELGISSLKEGIYFIRLSSIEQNRTFKLFVK